MFNQGIDRQPAYSFIRESKEWATRTVTFGAIGHAYQPPRKIFMPNGQKPFDMSFDSGDGGVNGRIFRETYGPILADQQRGIPPHLVFSFYPTIREWIKKERPGDYEIIKKNISALPKREKEYNVLGDPFLHIILPLIPEGDQEMLMRMGRQAFQEDFGFMPKGVWFPETAVSKKTLEMANKAGYIFAVLRDTQLEGIGSNRLNPFADSHNPVSVKLDNGREMAIVHFDSGTSSIVSFDGDQTNRMQDFFDHIFSGRRNHETVLTGTDLELYGHHKHGKEFFLRYALETAEKRNYRKALRAVNATGYLQASFDLFPFSLRDRLQKKEKTYDTLRDMTSWSCENGHNLGRWTGHCDCDHPSDRVNIEKQRLYNSLRQYNNEINQALTTVFGTEPSWREAFAKTFLNVRGKVFNGENFLKDLRKQVNGNEQLYRLFGAKIYTLLGFTSCGWFFGDEQRMERELTQNMVEAVRFMMPTEEKIVAWTNNKSGLRRLIDWVKDV